MRRLLGQCLEKDPGERLNDAAAIVTKLDATLAELGGPVGGRSSLLA